MTVIQYKITALVAPVNLRSVEKLIRREIDHAGSPQGI
jgi:hypothetical protein